MAIYFNDLIFGLHFIYTHIKFRANWMLFTFDNRHLVGVEVKKHFFFFSRKKMWVVVWDSSLEFFIIGF